MNEEWKNILADYQQAKHALWPPNRRSGGWFRDEEKGHYYMWKAYHSASVCEPKEPLLFARILSMLASQTRWGTSDYDRYNKYIKPAYEAYKLAMSSGYNVAKNEWERIKYEAESLAYKLECESRPDEEQLLCISGHEKLADFQFHDSNSIHFEHSKDSAHLIVRFNDIQVIFQFEGIVDMQLRGDPLDNWIDDFYCYPCYHDKNLYYFDAGFYRIICRKIAVENVVQIEEK